MGGAAPIPGSTSSFQAYNPNALDWQKQKWQQAMETAVLNMQAQQFGMQAEKHALQKAYYQPMLADALAKRKLAKGVMKGDAASLNEFAGLPKGTKRADAIKHIDAYRGINQKTAAAGGIMQLKKYAEGGTTEKKKPGLNPDQAAFVQKMAKLSGSGKELTKAQQAKLNTIETKTGRDVSPYVETGTRVPGNAAVAKAAKIGRAHV